MGSIMLIAIVVAVAYVALYTYNLNHKYESYTSYNGNATNAKDAEDDDIVLQNAEMPYVRDTDVNGDFEQDFVYANEGGSDPSKEALNAARRKFPFDWSQLPPSSSLFQAQQALFVKDPTSTASPYVKETFDALEAEKILPVDMETQDQYEMDQLKMYKPENPGNFKTDEESVDKMIQNIYGRKGLIARVAKKANNVYEVYETIEKEPKIVWEDDGKQASMQSNELNAYADNSQMVIRSQALTNIGDGMKPWGNGEAVGGGRQKISDYNPNFDQVMGPRIMMQNYGS